HAGAQLARPRRRHPPRRRGVDERPRNGRAQALASVVRVRAVFGGARGVKFALSRLIALVFGRAPDENYVVAIIVWLTAACYFFALVPNAAGAVAALLLTPLLLQLPLYATTL